MVIDMDWKEIPSMFLLISSFLSICEMEDLEPPATASMLIFMSMENVVVSSAKKKSLEGWYQ